MRAAGLFVVFFAMLLLFAVGLRIDPTKVPSPLIGQPMPAFSEPDLHAPQARLSERDWLGQPALVNIWASWCVSCLSEHPLLMEFSQTQSFPIYGIAYKDERADALRWLVQHGDPYTMNLYDVRGRVGIDWGVYGVPETFVIDHTGAIRHKHIGPVDEATLRETLTPLLEALRDAQHRAPTAAQPSAPIAAQSGNGRG